MNDAEKMKEIVDECDKIKKLIESSGCLGLSLAASLFHLALNEAESASPSNAALAAKAYFKVMENSQIMRGE